MRRHSWYARNVDVLLASLSVLACLVLVGWSSATIAERHPAPQISSEILQSGEHSLALLNNGHCFGTLEASLNKIDEGLTFLVHGSLVLKISENRLESTFDSELSFNSLDQLGGSFFRVRVGDLEARAGTQGVKPMHFKTRLLRPGLERLFELDLPGPIEIVKQGDAQFGLRWPALSSYRPEQLGALQSSLLPTLLGANNIKLAPLGTNDQSLCTGEGATPLDVTFLVALATRLARQGESGLWGLSSLTSTLASGS